MSEQQHRRVLVSAGHGKRFWAGGMTRREATGFALRIWWDQKVDTEYMCDRMIVPIYVTVMTWEDKGWATLSDGVAPGVVQEMCVCLVVEDGKLVAWLDASNGPGHLEDMEILGEVDGEVPQ